jgi:hypothetical protein
MSKHEAEMNKPYNKDFKDVEDVTVDHSKSPNPTIGSGKGGKLPEGLRPNPAQNSTK